MIEVATLWIVSPDGCMLLAQRALTKSNEPGKWGPSVTGRLEPGEKIENCLAREVEEELGLQPHSYKSEFLLEKVFAHPDGTPRHFVADYTIMPKDIISKLKLQESEVAAVAWHSIEEIEGMMQSNTGTLVPSAKDVWPITFAMLRQKGAIK